MKAGKQEKGSTEFEKQGRKEDNLSLGKRTPPGKYPALRLRFYTQLPEAFKRMAKRDIRGEHLNSSGKGKGYFLHSWLEKPEERADLVTDGVPKGKPPIMKGL